MKPTSTFGQHARAVADLEAENARLRGLACLLCGRDAPCELDTNKDNDPNWPGSPCTFDPSPVDAARRFMRERDGYKALAEDMMRLLQQADAEGKRTVGIHRWLRGIKSPPLGWVGDRAVYAVAAIDALPEQAREKERQACADCEGTGCRNDQCRDNDDCPRCLGTGVQP